MQKKNKIEIFVLKDVNSTRSINKILKYKCNFLISMSYDQIFGQKLNKFFKDAIINCHAGNLPFYRGRNILNWALINDEKKFGITVHFIDKKIDTGTIVNVENGKPIVKTGSGFIKLIKWFGKNKLSINSKFI